jgi:hypothetical protein
MLLTCKRTNKSKMPTRDIHKQFQSWAKIYAPVYSLILDTQVMIVLSSAEAVKEMLDKRSAIYSSRQDLYVGQTLCSGGLKMLILVKFGNLHLKFTLIISQPYGRTLRMVWLRKL